MSKDTSPEAEKKLCQIYRNMKFSEKANLIFDAYHTGQNLKMAGLRLANPEASKKQIWHLWAKQHLGPDIYRKVYGEGPNE
jgi:hypothetical protein